MVSDSELIIIVTISKFSIDRLRDSKSAFQPLLPLTLICFQRILYYVFGLTQFYDTNTSYQLYQYYLPII